MKRKEQLDQLKDMSVDELKIRPTR